MSIVLFKYLSLFTTLKWDSLWQDWNLAHKHTLYIMSGLVAVKYRKEPIMPLYIVESMDLPFSSLSSSMDELVGVFIVLVSSMLNLLRRSLIYFVWLMKVPFFSCLSPRKKLSSPIMLISNSLCVHLENSSQRETLVAPKIISSTYIWTKSISFFFWFLWKELYQFFPF